MLLDYVSRCTGTCGTTDPGRTGRTPRSIRNAPGNGLYDQQRAQLLHHHDAEQVHAQLVSGSTFTDVDTWALSHSFPDPGDTSTVLPALWLDSVQHTAGTAPARSPCRRSASPRPRAQPGQHQRRPRADGEVPDHRRSPPRPAPRSPSATPAQQCDLTTVNTIKANPGATATAASRNGGRRRPRRPPRRSWTGSTPTYVTTVIRNPRHRRRAGPEPTRSTTTTPAPRPGAGTTRRPRRTPSAPGRSMPATTRCGPATATPNTPPSAARRITSSTKARTVTTAPPARSYVTGSTTAVWTHAGWPAGSREQTDTLGVGGATVDDTLNTAWVSSPTATDSLYTRLGLVRDGDVQTSTALSAGGNRTHRRADQLQRHHRPAHHRRRSRRHRHRGRRPVHQHQLRRQRHRMASDYPVRGAAWSASAAAPPSACPPTPSPTPRYQLRQPDLGRRPGQGQRRPAPARSPPTTPTRAPTGRPSTPPATTHWAGRPRLTDPRTGTNRTTSTAYTPAAGGPVTSMAITNPMGWTVTDTYDPARHSLLKQVDQNGDTTEATYDGLGRTSQVWTPDHTRTALPDHPGHELHLHHLGHRGELGQDHPAHRRRHPGHQLPALRRPAAAPADPDAGRGRRPRRQRHLLRRCRPGL